MPSSMDLLQALRQRLLRGRSQFGVSPNQYMPDYAQQGMVSGVPTVQSAVPPVPDVGSPGYATGGPGIQPSFSGSVTADTRSQAEKDVETTLAQILQRMNEKREPINPDPRRQGLSLVAALLGKALGGKEFGAGILQGYGAAEQSDIQRRTSEQDSERQNAIQALGLQLENQKSLRQMEFEKQIQTIKERNDVYGPGGKIEQRARQIEGDFMRADTVEDLDHIASQIEEFRMQYPDQAKLVPGVSKVESRRASVAQKADKVQRDYWQGQVDKDMDRITRLVEVVSNKPKEVTKEDRDSIKDNLNRLNAAIEELNKDHPSWKLKPKATPPIPQLGFTQKYDVWKEGQVATEKRFQESLKERKALRAQHKEQFKKTFDRLVANDKKTGGKSSQAEIDRLTREAEKLMLDIRGFESMLGSDYDVDPDKTQEELITSQDRLASVLEFISSKTTGAPPAPNYMIVEHPILPQVYIKRYFSTGKTVPANLEEYKSYQSTISKILGAKAESDEEKLKKYGG